MIKTQKNTNEIEIALIIALFSDTDILAAAMLN